MTRRVILLALLAVALVSCAAPVGPGDRVTPGGHVVRRVRFEEDKVTCYVAPTGVACVHDQP